MAKEISGILEPNISFSTPQKRNIKIWVYSFKKNVLALLFCLFCIGLILFSNTNFASAKNGLILWATSVVPALFPFFVATELLSHTTIITWLGKYLSPIMRPLFGVPGEAAFAFLMGLISGYPVGAKIVNHFYEKGICTKEEAERMLAFTNNSGPLFIIGTVGVSLFGNHKIGMLLFITHVLSCISVGIFLNIMGLQKRKKETNSPLKPFSKTYFSSHSSATSLSNKGIPNSVENTNITFDSLGEVLGKSITSAISTILLIGGFVVLFSVIISILNQSHFLDILAGTITPILNCFHIPSELIAPILSGMIELTNGVKLVASTPLKQVSINILACSFLLGFGGISVLLQVFSIISRAGLSIKKYFIGKLLQGCFAIFYTFLFLQFLPCFWLDLPI